MSTNQFRRYLDLLNEADLVPPNTNVALPSSGTFSNDQALAAALAQQNSEPRCAFCGTPQSQHQALQHQFVAGGAADRPAQVAQGGGGDVGRVKQLQAELKAAGANLGATGPNRDGIDGDIGPLTTAAMTKYPDISAKYADLSGATISQAATPAVNTSKLTSALNAIETVIAKYKGKAKVSESQVYEAKPKTNRDSDSFTQDEINSMSPYVRNQITGNTSPAPAAPAAAPAAPTATSQPAAQRTMPRLSGANLTPAQQAAQRAGIGMPKLAGAGSYAVPAAAAAKTGAVKGAASKALGRVAPGVGLALGAYDAYDRTKQGDYVGAGISGLAGIASLFPGPGTWISGGLLAMGLARDLAKDPTVAITPEDAKTIADNITIIQDWQKDPANRDLVTPELKNRIANILKDVSSLGVPTQAATPATTPPQQAAPQQAATPAVNAAVPDVTGTLDKLDKLLKKNNFESREPKTLSEQMARDRDIVDEVTRPPLWKQGMKHVVKPVAQWTRDTFVKPVAKAAGWGGIAYYGYQGYDTWKGLKAPKALSAADQAEFTRLLADYNKMVPDQATFDALPPDVQKKLIDIANRLKQAEQQPQGN